ncbi:MAG TPA: GNAT family N-acetyltransferase [Thermoleophilaceae bacterium]|jgi:RimJ/RimL family protein N-acetyltransferase
MWPIAQPLSTERLELEPLTVDHAPEMVDVLADPSLYEFTGGEPPSEAELVARYLRQAKGESPDGRQGWLNWIVRRREDGEAVGSVQATLRRPDLAELAWVIGNRAQGYGFSTEATAAVIGWLGDNGVVEFEAHIHPQHAASQAVATRLGFSPTDSLKAGELRWELRTRCHN